MHQAAPLYHSPLPHGTWFGPSLSNALSRVASLCPQPSYIPCSSTVELMHSSSSSSYDDLAASAASLSWLAHKAQRAPLSLDEWQQFVRTTEHLRRTFSQLQSYGDASSHNRPSSPPSSTLYTTTSTSTTSTSSCCTTPSCLSSPMSSPSPSPINTPRHHHIWRLDEQQKPTSHLIEPFPLHASTVVRTKRNRQRGAVKECIHCGTTESSQWRRGPFDKANLCNACGLRYSRNFAKKQRQQQKADRQLQVAQARHHTTASVSHQTCDDTEAEVTSKTGTETSARSDIYALLN